MTKESENEQCHQPPKGKLKTDERFKDDKSNGEHLEAEELQRLIGGSVSGERLVAVLIHLDDCSECRRKLPPIEAETILKAVFGDEESPADYSGRSPSDDNR